MSDYHDKEVLNAGTLGTYRVHSLFTRISTSGDMEVPEEERFKNAVAIHAHEYTHYLHNLTTSAGLDALLPCFWLIVPFVRNTDEFGRFTSSEATDTDESVELAFKLMRSARGGVEGIPKDEQFSWPRVLEWVFSDPTEELIPLAFNGKHIGKIRSASLEIVAKSNSMQPIKLTLRPGLDFISEGVAYEVEREQCRLAGIEEKDLDSQTPSYPYLAYQPMIDHFVGRETSPVERVGIGNHALMTNAPSIYLFELCSALRRDESKGDKKHTEFTRLATKIVKDFVAYHSKPDTSHISQIKEVLGGSKDLLEGAESYFALIEKGIKLRGQRSMMELSLMQQKLTPEQFRVVAINLLERLVCQEKVEPPHKIEWIGLEGSVASVSDVKLQKLSVLQTSIHYLQQHFTNDGRLGNTANLQDSPCPFDGVCPLQTSYSDPSLCATKPWQVSVADGKTKVCWYEAGRLSLRMQQ